MRRKKSLKKIFLEFLVHVYGKTLFKNITIISAKLKRGSPDATENILFYRRWLKIKWARLNAVSAHTAAIIESMKFLRKFLRTAKKKKKKPNTTAFVSRRLRKKKFMWRYLKSVKYYVKFTRKRSRAFKRGFEKKIQTTPTKYGFDIKKILSLAGTQFRTRWVKNWRKLTPLFKRQRPLKYHFLVFLTRCLNKTFFNTYLLKYSAVVYHQNDIFNDPKLKFLIEYEPIVEAELEYWTSNRKFYLFLNRSHQFFSLNRPRRVSVKGLNFLKHNPSYNFSGDLFLLNQKHYSTNVESLKYKRISLGNYNISNLVNPKVNGSLLAEFSLLHTFCSRAHYRALLLVLIGRIVSILPPVS